MGTYLSSPIVEKGTEEGECLDDTISPLVWGVVDMQGWRKTMEDAHVAQTNLELKGDITTKAKVFGVFDGHGGPEVARFCQLYLIHVLEQQPAWKEQASAQLTTTEPTTPELDHEVLDDTQTSTATPDAGNTPIGQALIHAFHALDRMIDDRSRR
jgi:serine/threonine protein phosphatase PrpC